MKRLVYRGRSASSFTRYPVLAQLLLEHQEACMEGTTLQQGHTRDDASTALVSPGCMCTPCMILMLQAAQPGIWLEC